MTKQERAVFDEALFEPNLDKLQKNMGLPIDEVTPVLCLKKLDSNEAYLMYAFRDNMFEIQALYDNGKGLVKDVIIDLADVPLESHRNDYFDDSFHKGIPMNAYAHAASKHGRLITNYEDVCKSQWELSGLDELISDAPSNG